MMHNITDELMLHFQELLIVDVPVTFQISRSVNTGMMTIICPVHIRVSHSRFKE